MRLCESQISELPRCANFTNSFAVSSYCLLSCRKFATRAKAIRNVVLVWSILLLSHIFLSIFLFFEHRGSCSTLFRGHNVTALASHVHDDVASQNRLQDCLIDDKKQILFDKENCPRFATVKITTRAGLGHRFTEILMGLLFAARTNATYIFDNSSFSENGKHGSYDWFQRFIPLSNTLITKEEYQNELSSSGHRVRVISDSWENITERNTSECGIFYLTRSMSCKQHPNQLAPGCFGAINGLFDTYRCKMANAYQYSSFKTRLDLYKGYQDKLVIAWHIRTGDRTLNKNASYFETISRQLSLAMENIPSHLFFIGENVVSNFPFLAPMCKAASFPGNCSFPELDAEESLHHLVVSDVLITSGSSFAYMAALLHKKVVINAFPKNGNVGFYEVSEHGLMDQTGQIMKPLRNKLKDQLQTEFIRKIKTN